MFVHNIPSFISSLTKVKIITINKIMSYSFCENKSDKNVTLLVGVSQSKLAISVCPELITVVCGFDQYKFNGESEL